MSQKGLYGLMAQYDNPDDLLIAARRAYSEGYRRMDAYSPLPVHGLAEAIGFHKRELPLLVLLGGILGGTGGFGFMYWITVIAYPVNVGGRPLNSWPSYIPITFETTVLCAALTAVLGMLALNRLPTPYHPVFNLPSFALASKNRFFLCIEARDARFSLETTRTFLTQTGSKEVSEVAR
jgi:ActD protein